VIGFDDARLYAHYDGVIPTKETVMEKCSGSGRPGLLAKWTRRQIALPCPVCRRILRVARNGRQPTVILPIPDHAPKRVVQRVTPLTLPELRSKLDRQLRSPRSTGRSLQRTREAIIKRKFDLGEL
jgi:hypothetical protein